MVILQFPYNNTTESGCKVSDDNYELDYNAMKAARIENIEKYYWLASRNVASDSNDAKFSIWYVNTNGINDKCTLWKMSSDGTMVPNYVMSGLRPVITLYSDIKTNTGNGSIESAFELVEK